MTTKEAITLFNYYLQSNHKTRTIESYTLLLDRCTLNVRNPCNASLLSESFKAPKQVPHKILERETVDEMIYNTTRQREPTCRRTCQENWLNTSRRMLFKERRGYSPSAIRRQDPLSEDWERN